MNRLSSSLTRNLQTLHFSLIGLGWLLTLNLPAQERIAINDTIQENIASTTAVITFLTSQESVSSGLYSVKGQGSDSTFSAFKLPFRHKYRIHPDRSRYSMLIGYGRFDMQQQLDFLHTEARSSWRADSLSLGIGRSGFINNNHNWTTSLEIAYTQIHHAYHAPSGLSAQQTETHSTEFGFFNFNWHTDTLSIIPTLGLDMPLLPYWTKWHYQPRAMLVSTRSILTNQPEEQVSASSVLFENKIDFGEVWRPRFETWSLEFNPYIVRTDAGGMIKAGLASRRWFKYGLNFRFHSIEEAWWDGLSYGISYVKGDNFEGGQFLLTLDFATLLSNGG